DPDGWFEQNIKAAKRPHQTKRDWQWIGNSDVFGREFAKHDVQEGDACERKRCGDRSRYSVGVDVDSGERRLHDGHPCLLTYPAERDGGQRPTELGRGKICVEMGPNMFDEARTLVALFQKRIELSRAYFNDRKFARDKERVERHEGRDGR